MKEKNCQCVCHDDPLKYDKKSIGYVHDTKCCDKMFGTLFDSLSLKEKKRRIALEKKEEDNFDKNEAFSIE